MGPSMIVDGEATEQAVRERLLCASMGPSMIVDGEIHRRIRCILRR
jgi:hypothetical protein